MTTPTDPGKPEPEQSYKPNGRRFVWIYTDALDDIEHGLEDVSRALLVYLALARIACRERSPRFTKPHKYLSTLCGASRNTIIRGIADLERIKLITVERSTLPGSKGRDQNTYTLVAPSNKVVPQSDKGGCSIKQQPCTTDFEIQETLPIEVEKAKKGTKKTVGSEEPPFASIEPYSKAWLQLYEQTQGTKYPPKTIARGKKELKALVEGGAVSTVERFIEVATAAFDLKNNFLKGKAHTLHGLCQHWAEIVGQLPRTSTIDYSKF